MSKSAEFTEYPCEIKERIQQQLDILIEAITVKVGFSLKEVRDARRNLRYIKLAPESYWKEINLASPVEFNKGDGLESFFIWKRTVEGHNYWRDLNHKLSVYYPVFTS